MRSRPCRQQRPQTSSKAAGWHPSLHWLLCCCQPGEDECRAVCQIVNTSAVAASWDALTSTETAVQPACTFIRMQHNLHGVMDTQQPH
jgi:hypothetical protein